MILFMKQHCAHCGNLSISSIRLFILDLTWKTVKCPVCAKTNLHPNWVRKLVFIVLLFGLPYAYGVGLKFQSNQYMGFILLGEIFFCFIVSARVSLYRSNEELQGVLLHGWCRISLWIVWVIFLAIIVFDGVRVMGNTEVTSSSLGQLYGYLLRFGILLWITWDNFTKEINRIFQKQRGERDSS